MSKTVLAVLSDYMRANGYDGLVAGDRWCACLLDDLAPCDSWPMRCELGYAIHRDQHPQHPAFADAEDADFVVATERGEK